MLDDVGSALNVFLQMQYFLASNVEAVGLTNEGGYNQHLHRAGDEVCTVDGELLGTCEEGVFKMMDLGLVSAK